MRTVEPPLTVGRLINEVLEQTLRLMTPVQAPSPTAHHDYWLASRIAKHRARPYVWTQRDGRWRLHPAPDRRLEPVWDPEVGDFLGPWERLSAAPVSENVLYDGRFTRVDRFMKVLG